MFNMISVEQGLKICDRFCQKIITCGRFEILHKVIYPFTHIINQILQ